MQNVTGSNFGQYFLSVPFTSYCISSPPPAQAIGPIETGRVIIKNIARHLKKEGLASRVECVKTPFHRSGGPGSNTDRS